jgi:hypothetical protein
MYNALLKFYKDILLNVDKENVTALPLLDLSAAFGFIDYYLLRSPLLFVRYIENSTHMDPLILNK